MKSHLEKWIMLFSKTKKLLLFGFLIIPLITNNSQSLSHDEIVVTSLSAKCVDTTYTASVIKTTEYPSKTHYVIDHFVYEVRITLKLSGENFTYNKPLALTCLYPKGGSKVKIVNQDLTELAANNSYAYTMMIKLKPKVKGLTKITVGEWDDYNLRIVHSSQVRFIDGSFYLE